MADAQWDLMVAISFLNDVEEKFSNKRNTSEYFFETNATDLLEKGDFIFALRRIQSAEAQGADGKAVRAMAKELEGRIAGSITTTDDRERQQWRIRSNQAFTDAVQLEPTAMRWYRLGLSHKAFGSMDHAITCLSQAESMAEGDLKLEAAKAIDRCKG